MVMLGQGGATVGDALREVWHARDLLIALVTRDIKVRHKQASMGVAWAVLMPVLVVASGSLVRFAMTRVSGAPFSPTEVGAITVKALPWAFFVGVVNFSVASIVGNGNLVTKIYFPREVLPLSSVLTQGFDTAIGTVVLVLVLPFLGAQLSPQLLWVPLVIALMLLLATGLALLLSCANLFFRDVKYLAQVAVTFGIFFTPVFFEPAMLGSRGAALVMVNPVAPLVEALRLAVIEGHNLGAPLTVVRGGAEVLAWHPLYLVWSGALAVLGTAAALRMFHRLQYLFAERI
jgi:ABC-type polysaccharide/polyol phosphate export permease